MLRPASPLLLSILPLTVIAGCTALLGDFTVGPDRERIDGGADGLDASLAGEASGIDGAPARDGDTSTETSADAGCIASGPCSTPDCHAGTYSCAGGVATCIATSQTAADGATCSQDGHRVCLGGACVTKCDDASCASGCCADVTTCVTPFTTQQCGAGGESCRVCPSDYLCPSGACECPAGTDECGGAGNGCTKLTSSDTKNCGRCNRTCDVGTGCSNGVCTPTLLCQSPVGPFVPGLLALSGAKGTTAFWAMTEVAASGYPGYEIVNCDVTKLNTLVMTGSPSIGTLVDMQPNGKLGVYDTVTSPIETCGLFDTNAADAGTTSSVKVRTGACNAIANDASNGRVFYLGGAGPFSIDLIDPISDGGTDSVCIPSFTTLPPIAAGGGTVVTALNGTHLVATNGCSTAAKPLGTAASQPTAMGTDGTWVYFADAAGIHLCPLQAGCAGGAPPLAMESAKVTKIGANATSLYWVGSNGLVTCARTGCRAPTVLVPNVPTTTPFAVDVKYVYWVQPLGNASALYRVPN